MEAKAKGDSAEHTRHTDDAMASAVAAKTTDPNHYKGHSWYGICLMEIGEIEGSKSKIGKLMDVKTAWTKSTELNPNDSTSYHLLGRWCFGIVGIDWFSRTIANALFGTLPDTSYEEAMQYFEKAEKIDPGFWLKNQSMIAQCTPITHPITHRPPPFVVSATHCKHAPMCRMPHATTYHKC